MHHTHSMSPAPRNSQCCTCPPPPPPPPPSSPRVLLFPRSRRTRRRQPRPIAHTHGRNGHPPLLSHKGKLENLFDRENNDSPTPPLDFLNSSSKGSGVEKVERMEEREEEAGCGHCNGGGSEEGKWRFQAEILRAECNFLRLEREFALKKLEKNRIQMETTLRSAVQTLVSGRKKICFEGMDANAVLVEEIENLTEKLRDLQTSSRIKEHDFPKCNNKVTKPCLLQRQLEKLEEISSPKELQEPNDQSSPTIKIRSGTDEDQSSSITNCETKFKSTDINVMRKKMDTVDRSNQEENYNSIICSATDNSVSSSASMSKRGQYPEISSLFNTQFYQEPTDSKCSGHCKAVIWRIVEQVRGETEQWSQMQEMLTQVRGEMEELQASRDFWESRAHSAEYEIQSLWHIVQEWKEKALGYESKAKDLTLQLSALKEEVKNVKVEPCAVQELEGCEVGKSLKELSIEKENQERQENYKDLAPPLSLGKHLAKEMKKRMLFRWLKENSHNGDLQEPSSHGKTKPRSNTIGVMVAMERSPLRDIGNSTSSRHEKLNLAR